MSHRGPSLPVEKALTSIPDRDGVLWFQTQNPSTHRMCYTTHPHFHANLYALSDRFYTQPIPIHSLFEWCCGKNPPFSSMSIGLHQIYTYSRVLSMFLLRGLWLDWPLMLKFTQSTPYYNKRCSPFLTISSLLFLLSNLVTISP